MKVRESSESLKCSGSAGGVLPQTGREGESLALAAGVVKSLHLDLHRKEVNLPVSLNGLDCEIL